IANVLAYLALLGTNTYIFVTSDGVYRTGKETYLTPTSYAFKIWPLIHLLWLGYIVYQFTDNGKKTVIDVMGWRFPAVAVLSAVYLYVWAKGYYIAALVLINFASDCASKLHDTLREHHSSRSFHDGLWIHFLVSLYSGWSSFLLVVALFEAFGVDALTQPAGVGTKVSIILLMLLLQFTAPADAFRSQKDSLGGSAAITWGLFAISEHQRSSGFVHSATFIFATIGLFAVLKSLDDGVFGRRNRNVLHDEERALLLPST
ncbi:unnamed protein product, partial [Rhizoctonia solani]